MAAEDVVAACDELLRPLERAAQATWWTANVDVSDVNEHARVDAEVALSDALADADAFAEIRAARATAVDDPLTARALALLEQMHAPNQVEPELRRKIIELQSSLETTYATPPWRAARSQRRRQRDPRGAPHEQRQRRATRRVGGVEVGRGPRSGPTSVSSRVCGTTRPAPSDTATISHSRSRPATTTKPGSSPRSPTSTSSRENPSQC